MIATNYNPKESEEKWYKYWMDNNLFHSEVDNNREPYCIVIPPPNVTGVLHMGHMLNNTIQDALIRRARLQGKNACWVPGTDHASIATEAKVVAKLQNEGIQKTDSKEGMGTKSNVIYFSLDFYFMCTRGSFGMYVYVPAAHWCLQRAENGIRLELQTIVSHLGDGNQTQVLYKSSKCSVLLNIKPSLQPILLLL